MTVNPSGDMRIPVALSLAACGGAPNDSSDPVASSSSDLVVNGPSLGPVIGPIHLYPIPMWDLYASGFLAGWVDGSGNPTSNVALTYTRATDMIVHSGWISFTIWDDFGAAQDCGYALDLQANCGPGLNSNASMVGLGPIMCNGTPYVGTALVSQGVTSASLEYGTDTVAEAFAWAAGDTIPNVCTATDGHGATFPVTLSMSALAWKNQSVPGTPELPVSARSQNPFTVNVTLVCK